MMKTYITEKQLNKIILEETKKVVEMIDSEEKGFLSKLKSFFNKRNGPSEEDSIDPEDPELKHWSKARTNPPLKENDKTLRKAIDDYMEKYYSGENYEIHSVSWAFSKSNEMDLYRVVASFEGDPEEHPRRYYAMWLEDGTREDPEEERGVPIDVNGTQMFLYGEW